ncbi:hypothetical protein GCM10010910_24250 [Microbacterium nanhaiense]|uniref:DUF2971 domain-containing protein n=1 Tax=Microbacterium nanhaiense TaxID=1301026 RepID=A0ABQ2N3M1_9MICO|nr:DUF2971 domain-containing protein [Microbacterium nanhaiense]GGO65938.1 hypothetical protein GCM10010910_24250 [Microbacterium nanhaiense]
MTRKLYKYLGPELAGVALSHDGATIKFSLPREFNDPFELFLTVDHNSSSATLAFYEEVMGEILDMPTTCFSSNPDVVPMWAHYGQNGQGFVIEVDEDILHAELRNDGVIQDVTYRDTIRDEISGSLARAQYRQKPRDIYFLRNSVYSAAYFTKATCWSYEKERRLVLNDATRLLQKGGASILPISRQCVTAVILGPNVDADTESKLRLLAAEIGCEVYKCRIGRTSITPYFTDSGGSACVFVDGAISEAANSCRSCGEPLGQGDHCSWCRIQEEDRRTAAASNPWRLLEATGLLQDYISSMDSIGKK